MARKKITRLSSLGENEHPFVEGFKRFIQDPNFFLPLDPGVLYERIGDDHDGTFEGRLRVTVGEDGDVWLGSDLHHKLIRFRMPGFGGGMSPCTWNVLRMLAFAIKLDNELRPQTIPTKT